MKKEIIFTLIAAFVIVFAGCTKDNFDPPKSMLTGTITYNSNPVGVRSNLTVPLTYNFTLPAALASKSYIYARIGVKATGVGELLYTPVQEIQLN